MREPVVSTHAGYESVPPNLSGEALRRESIELCFSELREEVERPSLESHRRSSYKLQLIRRSLVPLINQLPELSTLLESSGSVWVLSINSTDELKHTIRSEDANRVLSVVSSDLPECTPSIVANIADALESSRQSSSSRSSPREIPLSRDHGVNRERFQTLMSGIFGETLSVEAQADLLYRFEWLVQLGHQVFTKPPKHMHLFPECAVRGFTDSLQGWHEGHTDSLVHVPFGAPTVINPSDVSSVDEERNTLYNARDIERQMVNAILSFDEKRFDKLVPSFKVAMEALAKSLVIPEFGTGVHCSPYQVRANSTTVFGARVDPLSAVHREGWDFTTGRIALTLHS